MPFGVKPSLCNDCPAFKSGRSFVPGKGNLSASIALIGQGPGEIEAYQQQPFVGPSGDQLRSWVRAADIAWHEVWVDNVVRCWLPKNRPPTPAESEYCWEAYGGPALRSINPKVVVAVGLPSARQLIHKGIKEPDAGRPEWREL